MWIHFSLQMSVYCRGRSRTYNLSLDFEFCFVVPEQASILKPETPKTAQSSIEYQRPTPIKERIFLFIFRRSIFPPISHISCVKRDPTQDPFCCDCRVSGSPEKQVPWGLSTLYWDAFSSFYVSHLPIFVPGWLFGCLIWCLCNGTARRIMLVTLRLH